MIVRNGFSLHKNALIGTALVDMYAKCGALVKAQGVFDRIKIRNIVAWNALIAGYAQVGKDNSVIDLFNRMTEDGIKPDLVTFTVVLNACSHAGLVVFGQIYFEALINDYCLVPTRDHFTCMVDILARAGDLATALSIIEKMPFLPDIVIWHIVMGACRKWVNVKLGKLAFDEVVKLDNTCAGAYVLMADIFIAVGMQEDAQRIEIMRLKYAVCEN